SFNAELAPQYMLFEQAAAIENLPTAERQQAEHRLREIKVVLIRTLISDQLAYVKIAKEWLTIGDLRDIRQRKIGGGKIGGKAAGMLLARRILEQVAGDEIRQHLSIPESYYLGADVTYQFMALNGLMHWNDQKYKNEDQIRQEYPQIQQDFLAGEFPPDTFEALCNLLERVGAQPLIVRSSSLLEDNFGTSFAGKYESLFCPNQGSPEENLLSLTQAIQRIYASIFNPDALTYRRSKGLQDYDERMAILIQVVKGERFGRYFLPQGAGVAFSRNQFRWSPQIRREDGFMRLVWGLGTRAVDRVGNDYPRLVALSHPLLHPQASPKLVRRYSQRFVDVIDLEGNALATLPVDAVLSTRYTPLRYIVQLDQDDYLAPLRTTLLEGSLSDLVITYDELLRSPVDTEFTLQVQDPFSTSPEVDICLLQCRPQSHLKEGKTRLPPSINPADVIFCTRRVVPEGHVPGIRYVVFVPPEAYYTLPTHAERTQLGRTIGLLNARLEHSPFICVGPGRWGTSNSELGVPLGYGDIYHARALVEVSGQDIGLAPEPSFGTHFFQDLLESNIYPLAVYLDDEEVTFNREFFYQAQNQLGTFLPEAADLENYLRLIEVASFRPGTHLELIMDDEKSQAVAFLAPDE
ncbi:MAG: PEP/pyruvate-binding domain-containing protein, partial [Anaerolineales bacterium]|nr:PEP/pyruvate-binding domain-containing protein [Anaerolineales bacterium]